MQIPTTQELYERISNDLKTKLGLSDDQLKKVLDALCVVLAGEFKLAYLFLGDILNNLFPDTADTSENGGTLDRLGLIHLNRIQNPASGGVFEIVVNGEIGSVLRAGLTFKSNDDSFNPGKLYVLDNEHVLSSEVENIEVRSLGGGKDYILEVGDGLTITEPVIGINQQVVINAINEEPLSSEDEDDYRQAILDNIQLEPQGGAKTDYRLWSSDAQGIRRVYPQVKDGEAGTVQVYVEATEEDSTDGNGTPSSTIIDNVKEVIRFDPDTTKPTNERGRLPIQANLEVLPIVPNPVDVNITSLNDASTEVTDSIRENLKQYLKTVRPFVAGADLSRNKNDILYMAKLQAIVTDVIESSNYFTSFDMFVNGVSQSSYLFSKENIPYLRNLNFI